MTEETTTQLPHPAGYMLLCAIPDMETTYAGGIIKADGAKRAEEQSTMVLFVLKVGPEAYQDKAKFPSGPWCKEGDFVLTRPYAGSRLSIYGKEFRLIADDNVMAIVDDPRGIARA